MWIRTQNKKELINVIKSEEDIAKMIRVSMVKY